MVLAAGLGTRLRPLTDRRAKPAVPFMGVPVVRTLVEQLRAARFSPIVVNLHHEPASVRTALQGLPVVFSEEAEVLGTAGGPGWAVRQGLLSAETPLLVVNGKIHTDLDFGLVAADHVTHDTDVSMVLVPNEAHQAFREVHVRGDRVVGFGAGTTPTSAAPLAFTGVHVLGPAALGQLRPVESDTVRDVYPSFIAAGRVRADVRSARWWEMSTPERYLGLHLRARRLGLREAAPQVSVAPTAVVHESVFWDDVHVGAHARLVRCVALSGVHIPAGTTADHLVFDLGPSNELRTRRLDPELVELASGS